MPSAERPQQGPVTLLPTRTHLPSPCAGDPSEGGTSSDGTSSYGAPPTKQLRPPPGFGPASDAGSDDGDGARRQRRRHSYSCEEEENTSSEDDDEEEENPSSEEENLSSGEESTASEDEEDYSGSEDEEDYSGAQHKARPRANDAWKRVDGSSDWRRNRSDCFFANSTVAASHMQWFPPKDTYAGGFLVKSGYRGGEIQPGDLIIATPCEMVPGLLTGEHNFASLSNQDSVAELVKNLNYSKPESKSRTVRSMLVKSRCPRKARAPNSNPYP